MKEMSDTYVDLETAGERKPVELYHFWTESDLEWYYSNSDVPITFESNLYSPTALTRGTVEWDSQLNISKLTVTLSHTREPVLQYIAQNPLDVVWVTVMRLFRDQDPYEAGIIFVGQIKDVAFQGVSAVANCVGFEVYLDRQIPTLRYQKQCNWIFGDANCTAIGNIQTGTVSSVSDTGLEVDVDGISPEDDGYYDLGKFVFGDNKRMITSYSGSTFIIRNKIEPLQAGDSVTVYPGCDGNIITCRDTYDNVVNFGGFPYIPSDNPCLWR
jgi:uncharacterized phage protein (TIGR02218 family)